MTTRRVPDLEAALRAVRRGIGRASDRAGRDPLEVRLVAVTKSVPLDLIERIARLGVDDFGENYAAELAPKATALSATWHYLGVLQSGTASRVADHAAVIHSARPGHAMRRLAGRAARRGSRVRALVQVDLTGAREGVAPEELATAIDAIRSLDGVAVAGLMTLPPWTGDPEGSRPYFVQLRALRDRLRDRWSDLAELSMGMSADYEVAVEEGATMVRVGTALFGPRPAADP